MQGTDIVFHPLYTWSNAERTGYDFATVRLDGPIEDAGPPPALYGGNREDGARIVMVGWGSRGIGSVGQKPGYYVEVDKAAATNRIDDVMDVVTYAVAGAIEAATGQPAPPFRRMTWHEAMSRYGTDKPDLRYGMELVDVSEVFAATEYYRNPPFTPVKATK